MIKITLIIDGMACSMCEAHVNEAVRKAFKVKKVSSSHRNNRTEIICDSDIDRDKLINSIEATGYKVIDISAEPYKKKFSIFGF